MRTLLIVLTLALPGCGTGVLEHADDSTGSASVQGAPASPRRPVSAAGNQNGLSLSDAALGEGPHLFPGTGKVIGPPASSWDTSSKTTDGDIDVNLVDVGINEAAKVILGDVLNVPFSVDDAVKGTVTVRTAAPVSADTALQIFQSVLRTKGAAISVEAGLYKIVPEDRASLTGAPIETGPVKDRATPGSQVQVVPLHFVAAADVAEVLKPIAAKGAIVRVDQARNLLVLAGTRNELTTLLDAVSVFDVDWMRGMSFGLFPVDSADPQSLVPELDTIFANDRSSPTKGLVRFIANRRLGAVLVIASQPLYLKKAADWIRRIDVVGQSQDKQLFVYHIQNRPAGELADLLKGIYRNEGKDSLAVAPKVEAATPGGAGNAAAAPVIEGVTPPGAGGGKPETAPISADAGASIANPAAAAAAEAAVASDGDRAAITVVADEANNSVLIRATRKNYRKILAILQQIDSVPNQVLLEAVIAEVTLNDELRFGVRWFFQKGQNSATFTDSAAGAVSSVFPGFSYFLNSLNVQVALNALNAITDVNVISAPSLMVLDNKKAVLQVGDDVPIATQSAVSVSSAGAPVVNSISFRNTGVLLSVTPRVSDSGRVVLEIEQEVSDVVATTSSTLNSPTIRQRKIKTTVAVNDGDSLALGGLIQQSDTVAKDQVPVLGDVPVLGTLFRNKDNTIKRTELMIFIHPTVVRNETEARAVTEEFRRQLNLPLRVTHKDKPTTRDNFVRILR